MGRPKTYTTDKVCRKCGVPKKLSEFYSSWSVKNGKRYNHYQSWCKSCHSGRGKSAYSTEANTRRCRRQRLRKSYGLTEDQYIALLESQGYRCAICGAADPGWKSDWLVDHDHATGKTRSILCTHCNRGLGAFRDDPNLLRLAAEYVEQHKK